MKILFVLVFISVVYANPNCAHTWSTITVQDGGGWNVTLVPLFEDSYFMFPNCTTFDQTFISAANNTTFGFMYGKHANFNIIYALTVVNTKVPLTHDTNYMVSKSCVFLVTAISPAHPRIEVINYNGAACKVLSNGPDGSLYVIS